MTESNITGNLGPRPVRFPKPSPISAMPATGKNRANQVPEWRDRAVVTGRAVVVMVKVVLSGLVLFELVKASGFVEKEHVAPAGKPAEQARETLLGKLGMGVAVTW